MKLWRSVNALLGPSWDHLGAVLGPSWGNMGQHGAILGPSWGEEGRVRKTKSEKRGSSQENPVRKKPSTSQEKTQTQSGKTQARSSHEKLSQENSLPPARQTPRPVTCRGPAAFPAHTLFGLTSPTRLPLRVCLPLLWLASDRSPTLRGKA